LGTLKVQNQSVYMLHAQLYCCCCAFFPDVSAL
jgi:hypothetical protein